MDVPHGVEVGGAILHVKRVDGRDVWFVAGEQSTGVGFFTMAGFEGSFPEAPATYEELPSSSFDARARRPAEHAERALEGVPEDTLRKVLHDNAASLYGLD